MGFYLDIDRFGNEDLIGKVAVSATSPNPASNLVSNNVQRNITNYATTTVNNGGTWSAINGTFTATKAGNYQAYGQLEWASASWLTGSIFITYLLKNGVVFAGVREFIQANHTSVHQSLPVTGVVSLAVGDVVRMAVLQVTNASRSINGNVFSSFHIHEI